jgi:hypothetical protein
MIELVSVTNCESADSIEAKNRALPGLIVLLRPTAHNPIEVVVQKV